MRLQHTGDIRLIYHPGILTAYSTRLIYHIHSKVTTLATTSIWACSQAETYCGGGNSSWPAPYPLCSLSQTKPDCRWKPVSLSCPVWLIGLHLLVLQLSICSCSTTWTYVHPQQNLLTLKQSPFLLGWAKLFLQPLTATVSIDHIYLGRQLAGSWGIDPTFEKSTSGHSLKRGSVFVRSRVSITTIVDSNILNTVTLAILVASFKLTHNKHSKFVFLAISRS